MTSAGYKSDNPRPIKKRERYLKWAQRRLSRKRKGPNRYRGGMLANHTLARAIGDVGLGELTRQIRYKAHWHGRQVFEVGFWQRTMGVCPDYGYVGPRRLSPNVREWRCEYCGAVHDRDIASAKVIAFVGAVGPDVMRVEGGRTRLAAASLLR
jgi:transposase